MWALRKCKIIAIYIHFKLFISLNQRIEQVGELFVVDDSCVAVLKMDLQRSPSCPPCYVPPARPSLCLAQRESTEDVAGPPSELEFDSDAHVGVVSTTPVFGLTV